MTNATKIGKILSRYIVLDRKNSFDAIDDLREELETLLDDTETKLWDWLEEEDFLSDEMGLISDKYNNLKSKRK